MFRAWQHVSLYWRGEVGNDFKDLFGDWRPEDDGKKASEGSAGDPERRPQNALNEKEVRVVNVYEVDTGNAKEATTFVLCCATMRGASSRFS